MNVVARDQTGSENTGKSLYARVLNQPTTSRLIQQLQNTIIPINCICFPTCSRVNADFNNQRMNKLQKNGGLEGIALNPAEPSDAAFVFFL